MSSQPRPTSRLLLLTHTSWLPVCSNVLNWEAPCFCQKAPKKAPHDFFSKSATILLKSATIWLFSSEHEVKKCPSWWFFISFLCDNSLTRWNLLGFFQKMTQNHWFLMYFGKSAIINFRRQMHQLKFYAPSWPPKAPIWRKSANFKHTASSVSKCSESGISLFHAEKRQKAPHIFFSKRATILVKGATIWD